MYSLKMCYKSVICIFLFGHTYLYLSAIILRSSILIFQFHLAFHSKDRVACHDTHMFFVGGIDALALMAKECNLL